MLAASFLPEPIRETLARSRRGAAQSGSLVYLGLKFEGEARRWRAMPWEAMPEDPDGRPLALSEEVVVYRHASGGAITSFSDVPKILATIAAPQEESNAVLDYEDELDAILTATADPENLQNAVEVEEFGTTSSIYEAVATFRPHILHISAHGGVGYIVLEDDEGRASRVTGENFRNAALPGTPNMPAVVTLAACFTDAVGPDGTASFAEALIGEGVSTVIATETSVTSTYCARLFSMLYGQLTRTPGMNVVEALSRARRQAQEDLLRSDSPSDIRIADQDEWATVTVLADAVERQIVVPQLTATTRMQTSRASSILEISGEGELSRTSLLVGHRYGRRSLPKLIAMENGPVVTVLIGPAGVGKSALAIDIAERCVRNDRENVGRSNLWFSDLLNVAHIRQSISQTVEMARRRVCANAVTPPVLVILDGVDSNLISQEGEWRPRALRPEVEQLLVDYTQQGSRVRFLLTTRSGIDLPFPRDDVVIVPIAPLSRVEARRLCRLLPTVRHAPDEHVAALFQILDGTPGMLIELERKLASLAVRQLPLPWDDGDLSKSQAIATQIATEFSTRCGLSEDVQGAHPNARIILKALSVHRQPFTPTAMYMGLSDQALPMSRAAMAELLNSGPLRIDMDPDAHWPELIDRGLATLTNDGLLAIPRWIARWVYERHLDSVERITFHTRAAAYLLYSAYRAANPSDKHTHAVEALYHISLSQGQGQAIPLLTEICASLVDRAAVGYARQLLQAWRSSLRTNRHLLPIVEQLGWIELCCQNYVAAELLFSEAQRLAEDLGRVERIPIIVRKRALIARRRGDSSAATELYSSAQKVASRLAREDESEVANELYTQARLAIDRGDSEAASELLRRAQEIFERQGAENMIAGCQHERALIARASGDYDSARLLHEESLAAFERLGDQRGIAVSHASLAQLAWIAGDNDAADQESDDARLRFEALQDAGSIASMDSELGELAMQDLDYDAAEEYLERALQVSRSLADRHLEAVTLARLANLQHMRGDLREALHTYGRALNGFDHLQDWDSASKVYTRSGEVFEDGVFNDRTASLELACFMYISGFVARIVHALPLYTFDLERLIRIRHELGHGAFDDILAEVDGELAHQIVALMNDHDV